MLTNIIFDWAGTLGNDEVMALDLTNATLEYFGGKPVDRETYRREFKLPIETFYGPRLPGVASEDVDRVYFDMYEKRLDQICLYPDADLVIRGARAHGLRLFILSSLENRLIHPILVREGLMECFAEARGSATDKRPAIVKLIKDYNLFEPETIMVGDGSNDMIAATEAGVKPIGCLYGHANRDNLMSGRPEAVVESCSDLFRWIQTRVASDRDRRPVVTVGGLIHNDRGEVLLIRTKKWRDLFGTPGGKVEFGESLADAFRREVEEETALRIEDVEYALLDEGIRGEEFFEEKHFIFANFRARAPGSTEVRLNDEASEHRWVDPGAALSLPLNTPTRRLIEHIFDRAPSES